MVPAALLSQIRLTSEDAPNHLDCRVESERPGGLFIGNVVNPNSLKSHNCHERRF